MNNALNSSVLVIFLFLSSGCLGAVDEIISDIEDVVDETLDAIDGDYPKIKLPERVRTSPILEQYDNCENLLDELREAVRNEMLVTLDQQSYWHWVSDPIARFGSGLMDDAIFAEDTAMADDSASTSDIVTESGQSSSVDLDSSEGQFSGTNNQESGVDEADFLKTDGDNIYMLNGNLLLIMDVNNPEFGNLTLVSNTTLEGIPQQMMIEGNSIIVVSTIYTWNLVPDSPMSEAIFGDEGDYEPIWSRNRNQYLVKYTVIDISDKTNPIINKELYIEGNYHTARLVDGTVRSVTHLWTYFYEIRNWVELPDGYWSEQNSDTRMDIWNTSLNDTIAHNDEIISQLSLQDFVPHIYEKEDNQIYTHPLTLDGCEEFSASSDSAGRGFTSIMTILVPSSVDSNLQISTEVDHITSSWAHVYSSKDTLVLAEPANDNWWFWRNSDWEDATNIHIFDISYASKTTYLASGRVNGTVQDQFSISEYQGFIRVSSTSDLWGRWWIMDTVDQEETTWTGPTNQVSILENKNGSLEIVGFIGNIANGETIWSSRFIGERGYLVTFMNIDPLWVLDLSDPYNPSILGELHVPGVSTYIHPIDDNNILTIGIGGGEDGLGLDWSTTQISLFDVSNTSKPLLSDTIPLTPGYTDDYCLDIMTCGWSWSYSEATYEHKAFTYWAPESLLAVPLSTHRYIFDQVEIDGKIYSYSGYQYVSMMKMINVDTENNTLSNHGELNHSVFYNDEGYSSWWSGSTSIRRSIFMGDYIYAFSEGGATVHRTADLELLVELELPRNENYNYYYGDVDVSEEEIEPEKSDGNT